MSGAAVVFSVSSFYMQTGRKQADDEEQAKDTIAIENLRCKNNKRTERHRKQMQVCERCELEMRVLSAAMTTNVWPLFTGTPVPECIIKHFKQPQMLGICPTLAGNHPEGGGETYR